MSLAQYIRSAYRSQATIPVDMPWRPDGITFRVHVRADSDSDFTTAREKIGIAAPATVEARAKAAREQHETEKRERAAKTRQELATRGRKGGDQQAAAMARVSEVLEDLAATPTYSPDFFELKTQEWDLRYPIYTHEEVEALAPFVGLHLVESVEQVDPDGEVREWTRDEIDATFSESAPLPEVFPDAPDDPVHLSGYAEGVAWSIAVLRSAVKRHLYLEAAGPLGSGYAGSAPSLATSRAVETSPIGSEHS